MSATNFTLKVLGIKDENISVSERIDSVVKKGIRHTVIFAKLSYDPDACPVCGTIVDIHFLQSRILWKRIALFQGRSSLKYSISLLKK